MFYIEGQADIVPCLICPLSYLIHPHLFTHCVCVACLCSDLPQAEWTPEILPFPQHSAPPGRGPYFVSQSQQELETFFTLIADDPL